MPKKITYDQVREAFESEGYTLLSTEYKDAHHKLDFICPKGHKHSIIWNSWQQGNRCGVCVGRYNINIDIIKEAFESEGYQLLTTEYINNYTGLDFICPKGHKHSIIWANWSKGHRCGICSDRYNINIDIIKKAFESEGYTLLSTEYKDAHQKLEFICPNGHNHSIQWGNWQQGNRCSRCSASGPEISILNHIKDSYNHLKVRHGNRTILKNPNTGRSLELDIWFPELNRAIEVNGVYWHREGSKGWRNDQIKHQLCKNLNIQLLTITDEEWKKQPDQVKHSIQQFLR